MSYREGKPHACPPIFAPRVTQNKHKTRTKCNKFKVFSYKLAVIAKK